MDFWSFVRWRGGVVLSWENRKRVLFWATKLVGWVLPCWCWIIIFTFLYDDFFIFYFLVIRKGKETGAFGFSW